MQLHEVLRLKGSDVHTIGPEATLQDVVDELVRHNVGSLIVCEAASKGMDIRMIGIITERDILRAQSSHRGELARLTVAAAMSTELITATPQDPLELAMRLMTENRVRHLPVVTEGRLFGIISIGDVVKIHHDELVRENHYMKSFIQGEGGEIGTQVEPP